MHITFLIKLLALTPLSYFPPTFLAAYAAFFFFFHMTVYIISYGEDRNIIQSFLQRGWAKSVSSLRLEMQNRQIPTRLYLLFVVLLEVCVLQTKLINEVSHGPH